jgi:hypothetical protein
VTESSDQLFDGQPEWQSGNPPWGVVRAVVVDGDYAIVFDDLNADYREVEFALYRRVGDGWEELACQDDAGFPEVGRQPHGEGWTASSPRTADMPGPTAVNGPAPSSG